MAEIPALDRKALRQAFERAAPRYDESAVLQREVGTRLVEHLDPIRIDPARIIDLGCGTGAAFEALARRYPRAELVGVDLARAMLERAAQRAPWWKRALGAPRARLVCADAERLPLAGASVQLLFSNLALQWCRPGHVFLEAARVLSANGLFLFSTFGPDTLRELREAFRAADGGAHVHSFIDMRDLKGIGAHNALPERPRGLAGRGRWRTMTQHYESRRRNGALPATFEVIYGHAWKVPPRKIADGRQVIGFQRERP
jgi:malonyl-CoA O-methyltransferase